MNEQAREARNAYKRKWAKDNRDKVKAQQERHWAKKAETAGTNANEARNAYKREWYRNNTDKAKATQERYWTRQAERAAQQEAE